MTLGELVDFAAQHAGSAVADRIKADLCQWLQHELGCPATPCPPCPECPEEPDKTSVTPGWTVPAQTFGNSLTIEVTLTGPTGPAETTAMLVDTGASVILLNGALGQSLNLPNQGPVQISGVTGSAEAYQSEVTLTIAGHTFANIPCVVDPSLTQSPPLLGLDFCELCNLAVTLNPKALQVTFQEV